MLVRACELIGAGVSETSYMDNHIGVVVIGRNEGVRLKRCLLSVCRQTSTVVYVDSGSTDGSVDFAHSVHVDVVRLDMDRPFSAGRARNEGFFHLLKNYPQVQYVQFIDGDCELLPLWLQEGKDKLIENVTWAIVAGRVKERNPDHSLYNMLCDIEWNAPAGETKACGGIFMARVTAMQQVGAFNPVVIAGEEPELCLRLRRQGWHIHRLDESMTLHDANITSIFQWWQRVIRGGHAYAQGCWLHGREKEHFRVRHCLRIWFWALFLPLLIVVGTALWSSWCLLLLLIYPLQCCRNYRQAKERMKDRRLAFIYASFMIFDKWPQLWGQILFITKKIMRRQETIIEYKS